MPSLPEFAGKVPLPCSVSEDQDIVYVNCEVHGVIARFSATAVEPAAIIDEAIAHLRKAHAEWDYRASSKPNGGDGNGR